jgi:hypothetical protein
MIKDFHPGSMALQKQLVKPEPKLSTASERTPITTNRTSRHPSILAENTESNDPKVDQGDKPHPEYRNGSSAYQLDFVTPGIMP